MTGYLRTARTSRSLLVLLVPLGLLTLTACGSTGSGNLITETRDVGSFTRIDAGGGVNIDLTVDPNASQSVSVTYDDNLLDNVVTRVDGDTLIVELEGAFLVTGSGRFVAVVTDFIDGIEASGGSDLTGNGVIESYQLRASGGSDVDLRDLKASSVEIDASGGTDVQVFASESITGTASGGSNVEVSGSPATVNVDQSGGADFTIRN